MTFTRKRYYDDICDRCRLYPKDEVYILCVKCKDEWLVYGMKLMKNKPKGSKLPKEEFEIWFEKSKKKQGFVFR